MGTSIGELERTITELEKNAPAIRNLLDSLPLLRTVISAAQMFGESVSPNINKVKRIVPQSEDLNNDDQIVVGDSPFTTTIIEALKEIGRKTKPVEMFNFLNKRGQISDDRQGRLKVSFTMRYLKVKRRLLDGNGLKGYTLKKEEP